MRPSPAVRRLSLRGVDRSASATELVGDLTGHIGWTVVLVRRMPALVEAGVGVLEHRVRARENGDGEQQRRVQAPLR